MASGIITTKQTISGSVSGTVQHGRGTVTSGGSSADHSRLFNREQSDQHPIEAITGLQPELDTLQSGIDFLKDTKLDAETALPVIEEAVRGKAKGMYFDAMKELAKKSYWYLTSEIDPTTKMGTKDSIISGPYDLGAGGGGGGGGVTTVSVKQVSWPSTVVVGGEVKLSIEWSSVIGEAKEPTGNGTIYMSVNSQQVQVLANQPQGLLQIDVSKYIIAGNNTVQIRVLDAYGTTGITIGTVNAVTLELKSDFNADLSYTGTVNYTYTPYGDIEKTVYFLVDGVLAGTQIVKATGESQTFQIKQLTHGAHALEVYFTAVIGSDTVESNRLYYDLIYYVPGNQTPIIASTFTAFEQEQYISFNIPYRVFIYGLNSFEVELLVNGTTVSRLTVDTTVQYWDYKNDIPGNYRLEIVCGETIKTFNVHINKSSVEVVPVTADLTLALTTQGRTNAEPIDQRSTWADADNNVTCEMSNFNWSSDGWVKDAAGNTVLRLSGDARVKIPYAPFKNDFKTRGKTIELELATSAVRNYSSTIISCLDKSSTDFFETTVSLVDIDTRQYGFEVQVDTTALLNHGLTLGTHVLSFLAGSWYYDTEPIDLASWGITLKEVTINAEGSGTDMVYQGDNIIIDYSLQARGFYVTPQVAVFRSQQTELSSQYKEDEHVRLTFVIERNTANRIIWMYINGIASGAVQYPVDDSFRQLDPDYIELGSNDATLDIYNIRVYDNSLNSRQVVNNWIADTQDAAERAQRYTRNNNYNDKNEIVIAQLPTDLPYIIWDIQPLPEYKGDKRLGNARYVDPADTSRNFTANRAQYNVQGTSSAVYPVKNIRTKYAAKDDDPLFEWYNDNGDTITEFKITYPDGIGANYFTFKVDYASSEGANNVELVRLYNEASMAAGIFTPPQRQELLAVGGDYRLVKTRVGIDGFPIVAFHQDAEGNVTFCTKANFNNDKANETVYGFAAGDESWEIANNSAAEGKFQVPTTVDNFTNGFEIRFPDEDGYNDMSKLGPMTAWVASTYQEEATGEALPAQVTFKYEDTTRAEDGTFSTITVEKTFTEDTREYRLTKFKAELADWFNVKSTLFYYIFTLTFLMIDSRAKNAFPTYFKSRTADDGGDRWFWLPYDMDTGLGIDNKGKLSFDYNLEDFDKIDGANVFNGQDSVMWVNVREAFAGEIAAMYAELRTQRFIDYDYVESQFDEHQSKWTENIFNEDAVIKYVQPLANGDNYLEMLQGSKAQQRKWWLYNRFKYLDSKFNAGDAKADFIQFRAYVDAGVEKPDVTITPYADIYATVSFANSAVGTKAKRARRNEPVIIENPFSINETETDQETYIYSASQLKSIGDISPFHPDTVRVGNAVKLQELKIGDASTTYVNPHLSELTLGNNILLRSLDVRNCINLTQAIDISKCINIEEVYFSGTKITGITLPDGGSIKTLHLPDTLTKLTIKNQPLLNDLQLAGTKNIESLWLENIPATSIDAKALVAQMKPNAAIRLIGIDETYTDWHDVQEFFDILDTMQGMDATGELIPVPQVTGKIFIDGDIPYAKFVKLRNHFKEVTVTAKAIICKVDFVNGQDLFDTVTVSLGATIAQVGIPEKTPTQETEFIFDRWETTSGVVYDPALPIEADTTFYAQYTEVIRKYTITFDTQSDLITVEPQEITADFGTTISKPTVSSIPDGVYLVGWLREDGSTWLFEGPDATTISKDERLSAQWQDINRPSITVSRIGYNKIYFEATDNLGIVGYAITIDSELPPTSWTSVAGLSSFSDTYIIDSAGTHTVWIKDSSNNQTSASLTAFTVSTELGEGITAVRLTEGTEAVHNFALDGTLLQVSADIDSHYENLRLRCNGAAIENGGSFVVSGATTISATCERKYYPVDFVTGKEDLGITEPAQDIMYLTAIDPPAPRYFAGFIIDGWYTDKALTVLWDFNTDVVTGPMTLYAKWVEYKMPTIIKIELTDELQRRFTNEEFATKLDQIPLDTIYKKLGAERLQEDFDTQSPGLDALIAKYTVSGLYSLFTDAEIRALFTDAEYLQLAHTVDVRYTQRVGDLVKVSFGDDDTVYSSQETSNVASIVHTYSVAGSYEIKIYGGTYNNQVGYRLGDGYAYQIVNPSKCIHKVEFAWDVTTTADYALMHSSISDMGLTDYMTTISQGAFADCINLKEIVIPASIKEIKTQAFESCTGLKAARIPGTVEIVGNALFYKCYNLEALTIERGKLTTLGAQFCDQCTSLTEILIPDTVKNIGVSAFEGCTALQSAVIGSSDSTYKQTVGSGCFRNCSALKSIDFKESVIHLGLAALQNCSAIEKVWLRNKELSVGGDGQVFNGCKKLTSAGPLTGTERDDAFNILFAWQDKIPDYAFSGAVSGTYYASYLTAVDLPDTLKSIGAYAFRYAKRLGSIILPATVVTIGEGAFYASGLPTVSIHAPVAEGAIMDVGNLAFAFCNSLTSAYLHFTQSETKITSAENSWWFGCSSTAKLYIPYDPVYDATDIEIAYGPMWNVYANVQQPDGTFVVKYLDYSKIESA